MAIPFTLPPRGRVALVYADVRYGAALHERDPKTLALAVERYEALLRRELEALGGHEVKSGGYAFLAVWEKPRDALRWCIRVQCALLELHWPLKLMEFPEAGVVRGDDDEVLQRGLRVRMGMHVGKPNARQVSDSREMKYYGPALNHVARIAGAAVGGQVLLSNEAFREVADDIDDDVMVKELGSFRLRGRRGAVRLIQVVPAALGKRDFEPVRTVDTRRSNLMPDRRAFVGRSADLASVRQLLDYGVRVVSIVGPSGIGKGHLLQRLGIELLAQWREAGGIWFINAGTSSTVDGLLREVAHALDVPLTVGRSPDDSIEQLGHAIAGRGRVLLLFDGFDEVRDIARRTIGRWRDRAPEACFVVACSRPLGIDGEVAYELGPLTLPEDGQSDSVEFFERVARTVRPHFRVDGSDVPVVFELVRALGGAPLGIQLVAAQIHRLSLQEMLRGLTQRTLRYRPGSASDAEDGLAAAASFAWDQMSFWERDAVAQCAVFRGGFDIEAAEAVLDLTEHVSAPWIGDVLQGLVEKQLVRRSEPAEAPGVPRYSLHPRMHIVASRRLPEAQRLVVEGRHRAHFLELAERWSDLAYRKGGGESMARLTLELDNLLALHERVLSLHPRTHEEVEVALRTAIALDPLLGSWGPLDTHLPLLDASIDAAGTVEGVDSKLRLRALRARAEARRFRGQMEAALADLERATSLADSVGDDSGKGAVLVSMGTLLRHSGRVDEAVEVLGQAIELCRECGDRREEGLAYAQLGTALMLAGDQERALTALEEGIGRLRLVGDLRSQGQALGNLGVLLRRTGDDEAAERAYTDAMHLHQFTGNRRLEGVMLGNLGALSYHRGTLDAAVDLYRRSLVVAREVGYRTSEANAHANLGIVYLEREEHERALYAFDAAREVYRQDKDEFGEGCVEGYLGILNHHQGRPGSARERYQAAERLLSGIHDNRFRGVFRAWSALLEVEVGEVELAEQLFDTAEEALRSSGDKQLLRVQALLREAVHLSRARNAIETAERDDALSQLRAALTTARRDATPVGELRLAVARLEKLADELV